ncbi:MAG: NADPH-dependent glutamate synthase [Bacteroidales bacterium]|jgi:glutamate synthase (NADPH/NADH) small chain|nr:NADPH-dependent glutamate synthase [Bacteroidales bacterium]
MISEQNKSKLRDNAWRVELREKIKTRERSQIKRVKMTEEDPCLRIKSNTEVNKGISLEEAITEARRCLDCINPLCVEGCPVGIDIPRFIKNIERNNIPEAIKVIKESNTFPAVCGRVCPQEVQCESKCNYVKMKKEPVAIGYLERFAADYELKNKLCYLPEINKSNNIKVAVIGSGPAGMSAAVDLAKAGYKVTVFEALHDYGGVLRYGIPEFRLPKSIINTEIRNMKQMGIEFVKNFIVGKTATINDLREEGYRAFFVGSGAGLPKFMNIPCENSNGILSSNEYLTRVNLMSAGNSKFDTPIMRGKKVAVIGGGNTAIDSVRTARRMGAERAIIIYRRSLNEMPARIEEIKHAQEEGIEFITLTNPIRYFSDEQGRVNRIMLQKIKLGEPDSSGRRSPIAIPCSEYELEIDLAIVSIGVSPNPIFIKSMQGLYTSKWGTIQVNDKTMQSNIDGIYAGGDIVRGGATVILAMGDGRKAAAAINEYILSTASFDF